MGKPAAGTRAEAPVPSRVWVSARWLAGAGWAEAPGVGGDAPAAALLASDNGDSWPAELYALEARTGASDVPLGENQGKVAGRQNRADSDRQRKPQVYHPDQSLRDAVGVPVRLTRPRPQHYPGLVLGQR